MGRPPLPVDHWAATRLAIESGETVAVASLDDPRLGAAERAVMAEWDQRALLATPMRARGRILGTLEITQSGRERVFTAEEVATAEACARMTALAVDNATLYERQADHARRLTSLLEAGRAITSSLDIHDVLAALVRTAATSLGCPEALIFEYDAEADTMTMRSVFQENPTVYEDLDKPYPLADYPSDRALLEAGDVVVETISDPDLPDDVRDSMERHGEKTCLTVPLRFGGKRLGMLTLVETAAERVFSEADLEFARGFAEQAAMAMHNAQLFENVKGLHLGNLRALSSALTAKDFYTIGHTARVAAYAVLLAAELGWTPRAIQQLEEATYLHDIGKIAVADRVLLKSGAAHRRGVGADEAAPDHQRRDHRGPARRRLRGRRAPPPRALGRRRLPGRAGRRGDPAHRPAALPGGLLRRDVVAPRVPAGSDVPGVPAELRELQRDAVRPRAGGGVPARPRRHGRSSGEALQAAADAAAARIDAADHTRPAPARGRGARGVRARPARPARDAARARRGARTWSPRRPSTSCAA